MAETSSESSSLSDVSELKIRYDWYQTEAFVIITILAKNTSDVKITFSEFTVDISATLPNSQIYRKQFNLSYYIVPEMSSYKVLSSKIEIKLKKRDGFRWSALESDSVKPNALCFSAEIFETKDQPPTYPSSSKKSIDWNKVEKEIEKQEAEEKPEGDALNDLFQQIYGKSSDEVRRAMNKSFQESGGTVLSTNWSEVSKKKVEQKPPDGMEWKSWNS